MTREVLQSEQRAHTDEELGTILRDYLSVADRLQRTHEALQEEVARLRAELASKDQELERRRRLAALGELAAGVAHEVRNPLGAIQLYSGLLKHEYLTQGDRPQALQLIEKIEAGIRSIDCVVQDTLALAPRRSRLVRQPLRHIMERARDVCLNALRAAQVVLAVDYDDPEIRVLADADSLQRVLVNLIVNAAEASPADGRVSVQVGAEGDGQVQLYVRDRGDGLPDEVLDQIFDPFFTTKQKGTGLGLTIAHRLIEAHGGHLAARNRSQGGAEFIVTLPTTSTDDESDVPGKAARHPSAA